MTETLVNVCHVSQGQTGMYKAAQVPPTLKDIHRERTDQLA